MIEKDSEVFLYVVAHLDLDRLPASLKAASGLVKLTMPHLA